jgi:hypothetical protein
MKGDIMKTFLSVTLLLAMASVGSYLDTPRAQSASGDKVTIYFGRGGCLNECSVYEMTIRPDRSVEYEGKEFTRLRGKRTYTISAEAYKAIVDAVKRAKVEQLKDEYKSVPGRDAGTITLRVSWGKRTKQIIHFQPSPTAPEELIELEEAILKNAYPSKELVPR